MFLNFVECSSGDREQVSNDFSDNSRLRESEQFLQTDFLVYSF